jgi:hypothetical protein
MDLYVLMFWAGIVVLIGSHIRLVQSMPEHSITVFIATGLVFVGSKIGREFLGLA